MLDGVVLSLLRVHETLQENQEAGLPDGKPESVAIGPIIAAGCGHIGDEKYEQHAGTLLVEYQLNLVKAIIGLTFPSGIGSFIEAMMTLMIGAVDEQKVIKVRLRKSASPSQPSSDAASRPIMQ